MIVNPDIVDVYISCKSENAPKNAKHNNPLKI